MPTLGFALEPGGRQRMIAPSFDFSGGALPAGATFTRAGPGWRRNAAGRLVSEAADVARFDHDPATLALRGLLVEPAATNGCGHGTAIDQFASDAGPMPVTVDAIEDPTGGNGGELLSFATGAGANPLHQYRYRSNLGRTAGQTYTLSAHFRKTSDARFAVLDAEPYTANRYAIFDLVARAATTVASGVVAAGIEEAGGGWLRARITFVASAGGLALVSFGRGGSGLTDGSYQTGDTMGVWGIQSEDGAVATSPIPTATAATAGRAADVLTLDWSTRGVADGPLSMRCLFDDGAITVAATVANGTTTVPPMAGRRLRRLERI